MMLPLTIIFEGSSTKQQSGQQISSFFTFLCFFFLSGLSLQTLAIHKTAGFCYRDLRLGTGGFELASTITLALHLCITPLHYLHYCRYISL